ncbi:efflux transporter outer membrane subunit [Stagnimonas aquatica]|uniref:Efflux transporter outer membrane subunit n=1 Tax=Stagnimonas aquatica TaxID=2689987 RepID=A0A3N0VLJ6_9GAMM|nr:efflux transporter outer membrane subunit [Stagnimonas aquatica]ROH93607.1 efflux transporter outer membrane subunit [Stagnimonas aquatica]
MTTTEFDAGTAGRRVRRWSGLGALLLAGCASLAPPYTAPALPVAAQYPADATAVADETATPDPRWQSYFADPRLRALIAEALANNRDLRVAALRVEEARAALGLQGAERYPVIGMAAQDSRARVPGDLNVSGRPVTASQYQVGLVSSTWELDFWGRIASLETAARENLLASESARQAVRLSLIAQVAYAYLGLRELDERLVLAQRSIASREESLRIFRRRNEVGATSKLELTQVQSLLAQAQGLGAQLAQARAQQAHALVRLLGSDTDLSAPLPSGDDSEPVPAPRAGLPSELLNRRPDLIAAEHALRAAQANIGAARAAFFPRITLTGSYGSASAELAGLFDAGSGAWSFLPSLSLPIFDGGRRRAGLDLAEVRREIAVAQYEGAVQSAFRDVADALAAGRWQAEQLRIQESNLAAQSERARLAQRRYDFGAATFLEVLDAQRELLNAEQQRVQVRRALLSARVQLYAALGGDALPNATP